ncbi:MAG TPA: 3D domain-containing protein [Gaiellaceae bacterium]|nr:3D domain-containing protein [Gaiellaceae bacterium]
MRPQAHTLWRPLIFSVLAAAALAVPAVSGAGRSQSTATLRAQDAAIEAKSRAAVLGLYSLDQQLTTARAHLASLQSQLATLRAQRDILRRSLELARTDTRVAQQHLGRRLQLLYERGRVEPIEVIFGARSLDQALTSLDNLQNVTKQDSAVLHSVVAARTSYVHAGRLLSSRVAQISAATQQAAATAAALEQSRAQRTAYISSLSIQRRLNEQQIAHLVSVANAAAQRSTQISIVRSTSAIPPPATPISASSPTSAETSGRTLTVSATGYALGGSTSSGLPVGWGIAAVDPSVIPLGTHMTVPGYGEAVAADTGGAIIGDTIDLWFPTAAQAEQWGRRVVTITLH